MEQTINRLSHALTLKSFKNLNFSNAIGMSTNTIMYLDILSYSDHNTVSDLSKKMGISKAAVTMKIKELQLAGYISKDQSKEDKRIFYIKLTDDTKAFIDQEEQTFGQIITNVSSRFSNEDISTFISIVDFITEQLEGTMN